MVSFLLLHGCKRVVTYLHVFGHTTIERLMWPRLLCTGATAPSSIELGHSGPQHRLRSNRGYAPPPLRTNLSTRRTLFITGRDVFFFGLLHNDVTVTYFFFFYIMTSIVSPWIK